MKDRNLFITSTVILVASCGLCLGLTYVPCYSAICVEDFFPYNVRLHIASFYTVITLTFLVLLFRRLKPGFARYLDHHVIPRPLPITRTRLSVGELAVSIAVAVLLAGSQGYFVQDQLSFYKARAEAASDYSNGYLRLAAVGVTGHLTDVLLGLIVLPISRTSVLSRVLHLSPSTLLTFHQWIGYLFFLAVVLHTVFFYSWVPLFAEAPPDSKAKDVFAIDNPTMSQTEAEEKGPWAMSVLASGMLSFIIFVAIIITSLPKLRRKSYNTFYVTHAFSILFFIFVCFHASTDFYMLLPGLSLWVLDWSLRIRGLSTGVESTSIREENGWYRIVVPVDQLSPSTKQAVKVSESYPLQSWYLSVPAVSKWQIHPFTPARTKARIAGTESDAMVFMWRISDLRKKQKKQGKEWTTRLAAIVAEVPPQGTGADHVEQSLCSKRISLRLEGPYPLHHQPFHNHDHVVCIVGGTGITGALALAEHYLYLRRSVATDFEAGASTCLTRRMTIIWTLKASEDADLVDVKDLIEHGKASGVDLQVRKHLTGQGRQRLDVVAEVDGVLRGSVAAGGGVEKGSDSAPSSLWVYFSGPAAFVAAGEKACVEVRASKQTGTEGLDWYCARWDV